MNLTQLLSELSQKGVTMWVEGERLRIRARRDVLTPSLQSHIETRKEEILAFLREHQARELAQKVSIPLAPRDGELPLSSGQLRFWFLDKLIPESPLYTLFFGIRMFGPLDVDALERSADALIERHEVLRTVFPEVHGQPHQQVLPEARAKLLRVDLSRSPDAERERELDRLCSVLSREPFDLIRGPLLRLRLIALGQDEHALLVMKHHIITDAWSLGVLVNELFSLYRALSAGESPRLPPLPIQYADYAHWQRSRGAQLDEQRAFWRKQLAGLPRLQLPTDRPRTGDAIMRGATIAVAAPRELTEALKELARQEGCTLFVVLLAAYGVLLHRYAGQSDVAIGTVVANRDSPEIRPLIGYFVNTLVLRMDLSGDPTFRELLARARSTALDAFAHADLPFDEMVEAAQATRDAAENPLFQVNLALESIAATDLDMQGMRWRAFSNTPDGSVEGTAKFHLNLIIGETPEGLAGVLQYSTDLFDAATIARMMGHFQHLLRAVTAEPGGHVSRLPLLGPEERHLSLVTWNDTRADFPEHLCLHELFEQQAARTPDADAVVSGERRLTYRELNRRANQLARALRQRGARPNTLVAAVLEKGWEQAVAVMAILKAGAAYVPIDPHLPAERVRHLLTHGEVALALTHSALDSSLSWTDGVERLAVDASDVTPDDDRNLDRAQRPEDLAYVIYTSGSTGLPKGVMVDHKGPVNTVVDINRRFAVGPRDRVLALSALNFDLSVYDVFGVLAAGGAVILPDPSGLRDPAYWAELIARERVTLWNTVPALMEMLVEHASGGGGPGIDSLRAVLMSGDWIPVTLPDRIKRLLPDAAVTSLGGATEASIWSISYPIDRVDPSWRSIPYGRPMQNQRFYVLDDALEPCPIGVAGALYIGGVGVALGYWRDDELTRLSFIQHPGTGERLYRTGDLGRYMPDGLIEFLGRKDFQVKIRGFRIELGEIEAVLSTHPTVREAAVIVREDAHGEKRLVAYVVSEPEASAEAAALREHLKSKLPEYMVPGAIVLLPAMPLTPNGKVDRKALPAPEPVGVSDVIVAPRTPVEEALAGIWAAALHVERFGVHDSFFALGGHSLLATQVIARVRSSFGVELPLRAFFDAPTIATLAGFIEGPRAAGAATSAQLAITKIEREAELPLSFAQQRLWFLDQLEPNNPFYNLPAVLRIRGPLDAAMLESCLREIVRRHEALRTTFSSADGQPCQVISPEPSLRLSLVDLRDLPRSERSAGLTQRITEAFLQPFDLVTGPLLRATLVQLDAEEHAFILVMHHIISDGWSVGVLLKELGQIWTAFRAGEPSPLPELPLQFVDYVAWQRGWFVGALREEQLEYWKQKLRGAPPSLDLPTDRQRPPVQRYDGAVQSFRIPGPLAKAVSDLGRRAGATRFMTLLAAFQVMLGRYASAEDVCVGSPVAGRRQTELEGLIGFFANTLVLRTDLSGNPTFLELLGRVRQTTVEAYDHQDVPFDQIVDALQPPRDLSRTPLFQVMFVLQDDPMPTLHLGEATLGPLEDSLEIETSIAKFDFTLTLEDIGDGLRGWLEYNTDLFDAPTARRMMGSFVTLLEGVVTEPERRISALPILTAGERQTLSGWNDTVLEYPDARCIHELFEVQASRSPESVAVVFEGERLTYRELNARANQLAHHLRARGVGPDVLVGLCFERSLEMVIGVFGVLKAGGAYVPLDPAYPRDRLAFMLDDARVKLILAQRRLVPQMPEHGALVLCLDALGEDLAAESAEDPKSGAIADNIAYVIYTSGSTGRPKGVMISHRSIGNHMRWMQHRFPLTAADRILQKTAFSFDAAGKEFFATLLNGAQLVMAAPEGHRDTAYMARILAEQEITLLQGVPSLLKALVEEEDLGRCRALQKVFSAGEALSVELVERLFARLPQVELVNTYGPTEAAIDVTYWHCRHDQPLPLVPIGQPMANTQVHVLDGHLSLVPVGVAGELHIGGVNLARGYLNRADLTAERFIPDPYSRQAGARMYKTGDLCRWLPDGTLEYLGRIDHQIKLRGFRIELGEIEDALGRHAGVREAAVVVREDAPGDKRLVAYFTARQSPAPGSAELRRFLQQSLPEYMVPAVFVPLDAMPLTPNGKVDRRALPAPDGARPELDHEYVAPRTPVEEVLAGIWAEVLRIKRVGALDNFFDLGGHSLVATQVRARVGTSLGVELPLRTLFAAPTVAELAEHVEAARKAGALAVAPPVTRCTREGELPLSFAQQRLWFLDQLEPNSPIYNIPSAARLFGRLDLGALERSLLEIVRRHEALRTTFIGVQGEPRQVIARDLGELLRVVDLQTLPPAARDEEVRRRLAGEVEQPFDLARGPLLRATLLVLGAEESVLLLTMHHIVSDGWSVIVFLKELAALYEAFIAGEPSPLPEMPIQYADFAVWQRQLLLGEVRDAQIAYWKRQLGGAPPSLSLPTDRPPSQVQSARGASRSFRLSSGLVTALEALSRRAGATRFMTLLSVFQLLLCRYAGADDISVGTPVAGRTRAEVEGLIGLLVNTLVLRTDLSGDPSFMELLGRVRDVTLGAFDHQDLPFEQVVDALQPERDLSRTPLFQVMFGMQTMPLPPLEFADMKVSPIELGSTTAKFYLDLMFEDAEDGMHGRIEYNTDLFDDSTIGRMLDHFQNLLESVLAHPERRLSAFSLLSSEERRRMLEAWNDTSAAAPYDQCFQELFEAQVARTPDAVAAVAGDRPMTYRALNARANRLAHHLREAGVGPDTLVALFMERGIDLLTAILAVFKSGGAYVPLDPAHPADRLLHVLDQGGVDRVVSTRELAPALLAALASAPLSRQPEVFQIEELLDRTSPDQNLPVSCRPSNVAYVIYTSGSTGMPKGVMIEQKGLVNHLYMMVHELGLTGADAIAQTASQCFDISVWQFLSILLVGGRVQILPNEIANDPEQLSQQVDAGKISVLQIVPSLLRMMLDDMAGRASPRSSLSSLRWLIPTGEALPPELCQRWFAYYPTIPLLNAYGPAECSDDVTFYPIRAPLGAEVVYTPIGRPAMNMQVYVLDRRMQPAPIGVIGELYVGGVGVGRGYLNAPRRTGEAFVPDPFNQQAGARLYGTGDLARWLPSGDLEFVGRVDHQVKIRGFRIELGEIEVVLGQHPKVRECVVLAREDVPGDQRLVAYAVAREGSSLGVSDLRSYLRDRLPEYMVPSAFITLEAMPLSPNGKIDRNALPAPDGTRLEPDEAFVAPRTPLEETLTEIWAKVLGVARVGIHDNFFTLGGHSLLATQVVSRIREAFSLDLPLRSLFTAPTVAELSNTVVGLKAEGVEGSSLDDMLAQLDGLSEEEVQAMLASGELLTDDEGVS